MHMIFIALCIAGAVFLFVFLYALLKIAKISDEMAGYEEGHISCE